MKFAHKTKLPECAHSHSISHKLQLTRLAIGDNRQALCIASWRLARTHLAAADYSILTKSGELSLCWNLVNAPHQAGRGRAKGGLHLPRASMMRPTNFCFCPAAKRAWLHR